MRAEEGEHRGGGVGDVGSFARRVRVVHERNAFITLPPDIVSAVLRSRDAGGEYPRHVVLEFRDENSRGKPRVVHCAWAGGVTSGGETTREIGVPHALAELLDIQDGDDARLTFGAPSESATAESVTVSPLSADDWEAVLGQAEAMEATLLSQIGLAALGQAVPFYAPGGGKPLSLRVLSINPSDVAVVRLAPDTELIVEPWSKGEADDVDDLEEYLKDGIDLREWLKNYDETKTSTALRLQNPTGRCAELLHKRLRDISYDAREVGRFEQALEVPVTTSIAVSAATAKEHKMRHGSLVRVFKYSFEREFDLTRTDEDIPSLFLQVFVVEEEDVIAPKHVAMSQSAARSLALFQGDYVRIKECDEANVREPTTFTARLRPLLPPLPLDSMEERAPAADIFTKRRTLLSIANALGPAYTVVLGFNAADIDVDSKMTTKFLDDSARALFVSWMREQSSMHDSKSVILSSKTPVTFKLPNSGLHSVFELELKYPSSAQVESPDKPARVSLKSVVDGQVQIELGAPIRLPRKSPERNPAPGVTVWPRIADDGEFAHIPGAALRECTDEALKQLKVSLWFDAIKMHDDYGIGMCPGILVTGAKGRGRSRLVKSLCKQLAEDMKALSCVVEIDCANLPKPHIKTLEAIRAGFKAADERRPSICYLLNLEQACPAGGEEGEKADDNYHLSCLVAEEMIELSDADSVFFIATTSEREALCEPLREKDVFDYEFEVRKPNMDARRDVLLSYAAHREVLLHEEDADAFSQCTDGYDVGDLRVMIDRAMNTVMEREPEGVKCESLRITHADLTTAAKGYVPIDQAALAKSDGPRGEGVDNYTEGFDHIGGFDDIKAILDEAMALPARYPKIFAQCPLRLPSGVLLYGAPGSGKSALAKAAIVNAGLRSITIKGPELFSKYYGESEAELRRLFRRAQDAAPCALFFDEFESLVPRRGSSDGGVTDRMVNQFLTLLDGVDSLVGVFVICATSRPDVVDPALLRPGRLDHVLYLPMPDASHREAIMECVLRTRNVKCGPGVDLVAMARDMEGYSGADIDAFVSECENVASRRIIKSFLAESELDKEAQAPTEPPPIEVTDIKEAKKTAGKPSLSKETIRYFEGIHGEFRKSREPNAIIQGDVATKQTYAGL